MRITRKLSTDSLAQGCARRPWLTVAVWSLLLLLAGVITYRYLGGALTTEADFTSDSDSRVARQLLADRLRGPAKDQEIVIVHADGMMVDDPAFRRQVDDIAGRVNALGREVVEGTVNYYQLTDPSLVSSDRHTLILPVIMAGGVKAAQGNIGKLDDAVLGGAGSGFDLYISGKASIGHDMQEVANADLRVGEVIGALAALIILIVVFGTLVSAGIPLLQAAVSIIVALAITAAWGQLFRFQFFVVNMISMMGLAVGIDYSLFIISRFREERIRGQEKLEAITTAGATAGRAALFSGMTVVLALAGMLIVPSSIFHSLGAGAIFVVTVAVAAALTLLPAILSLLGDRINSLRIPFIRQSTDISTVAGKGGFWEKLARLVMRRPAISLTLAVGALLACALPVMNIKTGSSGVAALPDDQPSKQAYMILEREFAFGLISPVEIVVDGDVNSAPVKESINSLKAELAQNRRFLGEPRLSVSEAGDLALLSATLTGDPNSEESASEVRLLREQYIPNNFGGVDAQVHVGGEAAVNVDLIDMTDYYRPIVFAFVLSLSFVLLTVVFHSLIVPLKAILMNLLSVAAAYGLVVLVFQEGVGARLFGFQQVNAVETFIPLFMFSILFGLSMDYHVFLLSRIRERYMRNGDNTESVAFGIRSTGAIITGAALIMVAVFGGFALGRLTMFQQIGFGLASAVLLDATLIRIVLVPSAMQLLGDANWYLPGWLKWLPDFHLEKESGTDECSGDSGAEAK